VVDYAQLPHLCSFNPTFVLYFHTNYSHLSVPPPAPPPTTPNHPTPPPHTTTTHTHTPQPPTSPPSLYLVSALQALNIARARGYSMEQCVALRDQLVAYNAGVGGVWVAAFKPSNLTPATSPTAFWQPLRAHAAELAELALVMHSIVPHSASSERVFSAMGWFQSSRRGCLAVSTTAKLTTIKMHVAQQRRCVIHFCFECKAWSFFFICMKMLPRRFMGLGLP
jgi:hypothetical protein